MSRLRGANAGTAPGRNDQPRVAKLKKQRIFLHIALAIAVGACGDELTGVDAAERETTLHVQPDAGLTPDDPSGVVALSTRPAIAGGWMTIERCEDREGRPVPANLAAGTCEEASGTWAVARDAAGTVWQGAAWTGSNVLRFDRFVEQAPTWYRASYTAAPGSGQADIDDCRWTLAEDVDVGVLCSSSTGTRVLPWTVPEAEVSEGN